MADDLALPVLATSVSRLTLRPLVVDDAEVYFDLVVRNRGHLTRFGDYEEVKAATLESVAREFARSAGRNLRFGIWLSGRLVGRVDLNPVDPPRYSMGYWLDEGATGRGYMTAACGALVDFARVELGATEVFAGVTHGNLRSVAVLERLGFGVVAEFERYTRFRLVLRAGQVDPGR
ncbi:GNAT family N-acetyltransferase [Nonomuraea sp. NPDC050790]|uniref:GNAT family N-acetyltransferase n=1 Tax=Nonomuraea sp. NPDC050790 TaxID=3364371 RepID=UPI0037ABC020